jgi:hypothetical protein
MLQRLSRFLIKRPCEHPLARGLVFADIGAGASTLQCADSSVYGNHSVWSGDPVWSFAPELARWGSSPSSKRVQIQNPIVFAHNVPWTFAWWGLSGTAVANNPRGWFGGSGGAGDRSRISYDVSSSRLRIYKSAADATNTLWHFPAGVAPGSLDHFVMTCDGAGSLSLWRNGVFFSTATGVADTGINVYYLGWGYNNYASGFRADSLIWNRTLSSGEHLPLADPSNTLLRSGGSDLIVYSRSRSVSYANLAAPPAAAKPALWMGVCA